MAKIPNKSIKTPVLELGWVNIEGKGKDNFNQDGKVYIATAYAVEGSPEEKILVDTINAYWTANKPKPNSKAKSLGYRPEVVDEEETGRTAFTFSTNTTFAGSNNVVKIPVLNFKGDNAPLQGRRIGNGSRGVLHGSMGLYQKGANTGVSLYLKAVQLTKLVEYSDIDVEALQPDDDDSYTGEDNYVGETAPNETEPEAKPTL